MSLRLRFAVRSDVGRVRTGNEDAAYVGPQLAAVADGMGGHAGGEVASRIAIAAVQALDGASPEDPVAALNEAVHQANEQLRSASLNNERLDGMGTTLTALLAAGDRLGLVHIGDSRAYLCRNGRLTQVTRDQTYVQMLVDEGRITPEQAAVHPQRNVLLQALSGDPGVETAVSVREARLGDRYLLCTDGLSGVVSEAEMLDCLSIPDAQQAANRLVDLALRAGGPDNITAVVADVVDEGTTTQEPEVAGAAVMEALPPADASPVPARASRASGGRHRVRRVLLGVSLLLLVLGAVSVASVDWVRTHYYYVASSSGHVVIYQGVRGLQKVVSDTRIPVSALDETQQATVTAGTTPGSRAEANRYVAELRHQLCPAPVTPKPKASGVPKPPPSPTRRTTTTKAPTAAPRSTPRPTPSATASPLPGFCAA